MISNGMTLSRLDLVSTVTRRNRAGDQLTSCQLIIRQSKPNYSLTKLSYRDARLCCMKRASWKMKRDQKQVFELWTWLTLLAVVGAYLGTWLFLLILKALQA